MGTRSLTKVFDNKSLILTMYAQYDGHPYSHGARLGEFLSPIRMINGIVSPTEKTANGAGCLAAQLVARFKTEVGNFYLVTDGDHDQEYEYEIHGSLEAPLKIAAYAVVCYGKKKLIFSGTPHAFLAWCKEPEPEDGYKAVEKKAVKKKATIAGLAEVGRI